MTLAARLLSRLVSRPVHSSDRRAANALPRQTPQHNASLAQVAEAVGYDSEAALSRAFKKTFGVAPATWRRSNSHTRS